MKNALKILLFLTLTHSLFAQEMLPFIIALPQGFMGAQPTAVGPMKTYIYTRPSAEEGVKTLFQINFIAMTPAEKESGLDKILERVLHGIEVRRTGFKKSEFAKSSLASLEALTVEWEGVGQGYPSKGKIICSKSGDQLICIHYQDAASSWEKSKSDVEKALKSFMLSQ